MGGKSSSSNTTVNNIEVKPVTNVEIDTEKIAKAIKDSSENQLSTEKAKLALAQAGLKLEAKKASFNIMQEAKKHNQLILLAILIGSIYGYKKLKKGKQVK